MRLRYCLDCNLEILNRGPNANRCISCQKNHHKKIESINAAKRYKSRKLHRDIRNKIEDLINEGFSEQEISKKLNLKRGNNGWDKNSIKWYKHCIKMKYAGAKTHLVHLGLAKRIGKLGGKKRIEKLKKDGKLLEFQRSSAFKSVQKRKENGTFLKYQSNAGKKGGPVSLKIRRDNSPYIFMNCKFDSNEEKEFCRLLIKYKIIKKPFEGINCHVKIGNKDIDFFIQKKLFIEYHPPYGLYNYKKDYKKYSKERRKLLNKEGFKNHRMIVIKNLNEFPTKILPLFDKNGKYK